jgi:nucleoside-diphosphate-sugar epimerase
MSKVFVSGIKGFIGSHLAKSLAKDGHQVLGIDNMSHSSSNKLPKSMYSWGDVRYYSQVSAYVANCDTVYHLAAEISVDKSVNEPSYVFDSNVNGTLNILEACRKFNKRLIFASSSEVYGSAMTSKISETHELNGQSPYAASKTAGDRLCYSYWKTYGTPVTIVRNFNTFGEYQAFDSYGGVISKFTYRCLKNLPPQIYGTGEQERDYMNVEDAVEGYKVASKTEMIGKTINFGTGKTVKIKDLAEMVVKFTGANVTPEHISARPGEVERLCADITLAESLGFKPKTDFEKDLKVYVKWFGESQ